MLKELNANLRQAAALFAISFWVSTFNLFLRPSSLQTPTQIERYGRDGTHLHGKMVEILGKSEINVFQKKLW